MIQKGTFKMNNITWSLEDAQKLADENPYSFYKPSPEVISKLKKGKLVKLIFNTNSQEPYAPSAERMWVEVTRVDKKGFKGTLSSMPSCIKGLHYGDLIKVEAKHVIQTDIHDPIESPVDRLTQFCLVTKNILLGTEEVGFLVRNATEYEHDSGWFITSGTETDEYMDDDENLAYVPLSEVLKVDDSFVELLDSKHDSAFFREVDDTYIAI